MRPWRKPIRRQHKAAASWGRSRVPRGHSRLTFRLWIERSLRRRAPVEATMTTPRIFRLSEPRTNSLRSKIHGRARLAALPLTRRSWRLVGLARLPNVLRLQVLEWVSPEGLAGF